MKNLFYYKISVGCVSLSRTEKLFNEWRYFAFAYLSMWKDLPLRFETVVRGDKKEIKNTHSTVANVEALF